MISVVFSFASGQVRFPEVLSDLFPGQHCTLWENRSGIYSGRENTAGSLPWSWAEGKSWRIVNTLELLVWSSQEEEGKKKKEREIFEILGFGFVCLKGKVFLSGQD